jgi:hypothetical protein
MREGKVVPRKGQPKGSGGGFGFETSESGFPHSPQNLDPGAFANPQLAHLIFSGAPHSPQNFMPLAFSARVFETAGLAMHRRGLGPPTAIDRLATRIQAMGAHTGKPADTSRRRSLRRSDSGAPYRDSAHEERRCRVWQANAMRKAGGVHGSASRPGGPDDFV